MVNEFLCIVFFCLYNYKSYKNNNKKSKILPNRIK